MKDLKYEKRSKESFILNPDSCLYLIEVAECLRSADAPAGVLGYKP